MVVFIGAVSFDGSPLNTSKHHETIDALRVDDGFAKRSIGDGRCSIVGRLRHRLDEPRCVFEKYGPFVIAGSVRLNNRVDLFSSLGEVASDETSDGPLVARAFAKWGPDCARRLYGEYGFVVWDSVNRKLFLVSDHIRSVRLFALRERDRVLFSNNLEGLTHAASVVPKVSLEVVADFLARPTLPARHTYFADIVSAQPGGYTEISARAERESVWWHPLDILGAAGTVAKECEAAFSHHAMTAVANCTGDDAVYGSHLTGGIDSGAVSLLASELLEERGRKLEALFSWTPPVSDENPHLGRADERNFLEAFSTEHDCKLVLGNTSVDDYQAFLRLPFELLGTADVVDELATIRQAKREGVEVILSGWGGDEAFSAHGFGYLPWVLGQGRLLDVARATRQFHRTRHPAALLGQIWKSSVVQYMPDGLYRRLSGMKDAFANNCYRSNWLDGYAKCDKQLKLATRVDPHPHKYSLRLFSTAYPADRVETWRNWSADYGLQYRYPLLDRALLEFMFSVPPDIAFGRGARNLAGRHFVPKLPQGIGKRDAANEARRARTREQCWERLRGDVQSGLFDAPCDYVDTSRLKQAIMQCPKQHDVSAAVHFAELTGAVRGFFLYQRSKGYDTSD
ncbi:MAG: asparagine synthase-related protein [Pseudomonadota bacterium]